MNIFGYFNKIISSLLYDLYSFYMNLDTAFVAGDVLPE